MAKPSQGKDMSRRLRGMVEKRFPNRGRFRELEEVSSISGSRWKNFFYGRQEATLEMIDFWCKKYPDERDWLLDGPSQVTFDSVTIDAPPMPKKLPSRTIAERLIWVIFEWAAPSGDSLLIYLEENSKGTIPAEKWKNLLINHESPSAEMIALVCDRRPHFMEWVIRGRATMPDQVDPTDKESVEKWKTDQEDRWVQGLKNLLPLNSKK